MGLTPEQQRHINKERKHFSKNWYLDLSTIEIRHNKLAWWYIPLDFIWRRKSSVFSMYWYIIEERRINEKARAFDFPLITDKIPITGQPTKYKLQGNWNIPKKDLKYLSGGPLVDKNFKLLVPPNFIVKNFCLNMIPVIKILTLLVTFVGSLLKWWPQINKLF